MPGLTMRYTSYHVVVFLLTYCTYIIFHASRKVYSDVKDSLRSEWTSTDCNQTWPCPYPKKIWSSRTVFADSKAAELFLGTLDTAFLLSYAVGMFFTSALADRIEIRIVLSIGMWISGLLLFLFGYLTELLHFYNVVFYAILWSLQGIVQSVGWPSCVAALGNWFGKSGRGILYGFWGSCASVGNIMGNVIAGGVLIYGYEYAFLIVTALMIGGGVIVFCGLISSPEDVGLPRPPENIDTDDITGEDMTTPSSEADPNPINKNNSIDLPIDDQSTPKNHEQQALSFKSALCIPNVIPYALSFAFLKLVNYAFLFWLPFYLVNNFQWNESLASQISTWYDVGGILGGIVCGVLSDRLKNRSPVLLLMLIICPFSLWGYKMSPPVVITNSLLMAIAGFFVNGVSNILSTAIPVDLAKQSLIKENKKSLATVTGIIDGTGSLGAAFGQYVVAVIQTSLGWKWVFNFFILSNIAAIICLIPVFYREFKEYSCFLKLSTVRRGNYTPFITEENDTDNE